MKVYQENIEKYISVLILVKETQLIMILFFEIL